MHRTAELGIAAHWKYKSGVFGEDALDSKLSWVRKLLEVQNDVSDADDFMKTFKIDLFSDQVFVSTPKGDIINLPAESNIIDFAYTIHTDIGNKTVGAIVNNKIVPLSYELQTGDIITMRINKNSFGPSEDWLTFVKTSTARSQIRKAVAKRQQTTIDESKTKEALYQKGMKMFEDYCKERFFDVNEAKNHIDLSVLNNYDVSTKYDLFVLIGQKSVAASNVIARLFDQNQSVEDQLGVLKKKGYTVKRNKNEGFKSPL